MGEIVLYVLVCALAGWIAHLVGKSGFGWFLLFFIATPIMGVLVAVGMAILGEGEHGTGHGPE